MADEALSIYDEIEIEDMTFDPNLQIYHYPCPCGDRFEIAIDDLRDGEDIAVCPSCSLMIRVIFEVNHRIWVADDVFYCSLIFPKMVISRHQVQFPCKRKSGRDRRYYQATSVPKSPVAIPDTPHEFLAARNLTYRTETTALEGTILAS
ncbi:Diphthamide biosynthesis protein 3 [Aspergillus turcosus]|uniref:Diphthamide biosynthesis protein 3 n=1 Tax=Aspergillus turcosus TaxID=1245748 RepID=A0A3R7FCG1_9EURO|nr:Diphthamide biosynthesis protein 3 [Aspergillus turcosus]